MVRVQHCFHVGRHRGKATFRTPGAVRLIMDLRRLRYFVTVSEEMHFGRAAERLHMAQQPLSAQIAVLEAEVGCKLFERAANRITLTAAGAVLLHEARKLLAHSTSALELTRRAARGEIGLLRIGHCSPALRHIVPAAIQSIKQRFPDLGVSLREMHSSDQLLALERGEIDFGFTYGPVDESAFVVLNVYEDHLVVALPVEHELANAGSVEPRSLENEPYIALSASSNACVDQINALLSENDKGRTPAYEVDDKTSAFGLVANAMGFTVLPELAAFPYPNITLQPLLGSPPLPFVAIWSRRGESSNIQQRFIETIRSMVHLHQFETAQANVEAWLAPETSLRR